MNEWDNRTEYKMTLDDSTTDADEEKMVCARIPLDYYEVIIQRKWTIY